nr:hypothetical protein [Prescottella equi]
LRGMPNDVFFKVGLITLIGLSAKNAILIIEFAKSLVDRAWCHPSCHRGGPPAPAAHRDASLAFILGLVPLAIATGASSASQQASVRGSLAAC